MKLALILVLGATLQVSARGYAQERISVNFENIRLDKALKVVEKKSDFRFVYSNLVLSDKNRVTISARDIPVLALLKKIFENTDLTYTILANNLVVIKEAGQVIKEISVSGRITDDATGQPIFGASIRIKGSNIGTTTDNNGNYSIDVADNAVLLISSIGYESLEIPVNGRKIIDIAMKSIASGLDAVVVVGYGTAKRKDLTGAVTTISDREFDKGPITSPAQLISGKLAGVQIISNGGAPGSGSTIRIRSGSSLNASNDPLIVIDGVPVDNKGISGTGDALSLLNPGDIASFTILKDASAAAIYGSRASNGVILITTKKGIAGKELKLSLNTLQSVEIKTGIVGVLSGSEYKNYLKEYLEKTVNDPVAIQQKMDLAGQEQTNWQDKIYHSAFKTDNTISLMGGIKNLPYRLSLGYLNESGILKTSNFERVSGDLSVSRDLFDNYLKINLNLKGSLSKSRFANSGAIGAAVAFDPTQPVFTNPYDPNQPLSATNTNLGGYFEWVDNNGVPILLAGKNPVSILDQEQNNGSANRSIGNIQFDYKLHFLPDIHLNLNLGYDISKSHGTDVLPPTLASVYTLEGTTSRYSQRKRNEVLDFYLNYDKDLEKIKSEINAMLGYSFQDFLIDEPAIIFKSGIGNDQPRTPFKTQNTLISYFGRLNYAFNGRYFLTGTIRTDGSSRFAPENRWGVFPSMAAAWDMKEESFLRSLKSLSLLKLRIGYGKTGQQDITTNDYPYLAIYNRSDDASSFPFGNTFYNMLRPAAYDQNIKWEETTTLNMGLDFEFANSRIGGSIDYFKKQTNHLISSVTTATGSNFSNILLTNVGDMDTKGIEVNINVVPVLTNDVKWNVNFNLTHYNSKITKLTLTGIDDPESPGTAARMTSFTDVIQFHKVGYAPFTYYVQKQVYGADGMPIEGSYEDLNHDGVVDEKDFYHYKSPNPTLLMGLSMAFSYKKIGIDFTVRSNLGGYDYNLLAVNTGYGDAMSFANFLGNVSNSIKKTGFAHRELTSDFYIENASFLRMDNVNITYDIGKVGKKANLVLSANVQNVFILTGYSGLDPEVYNGIDNNFYPRPRIFSVGANLKF